ncbi:MAG TPA: MFS transporter [Candidatus Binatia bacterium]
MSQSELARGRPETVAASVTAVAAEEEPSRAQKSFILSLVCSSHTLNHIQSGVTSVLFPAMMKDLGFGFLQLGVLSAAHHFAAQGLQVVYGFLAAFFKRAVILGTGNVILGISVLIHAFLGSYGQLLGARVFSSVGASAQNPMGASILSGYFPKSRGSALTLHNTAGNIGSFLAPAIAASLLLVMGWRQVFLVLGVPSILMGVCYFTLRDRVPSSSASAKRKAARASLDAYRRCLKDRNIVFTSLILMVGAAGRGTGFNVTYLVPYFMERFAITASQAGFLLMAMHAAGVVGPLGVGWVSDRAGRRAFVMQSTLLFSAVLTVWLAHQTTIGVMLFINLILYGSFVQARGSITQAMIGDFATEENQDAAFSLYYFIGFISGPLWTLVTGFVMDRFGFTPAFYLAGASYLAGMVLLGMVGSRHDAPPSTGP